MAAADKQSSILLLGADRSVRLQAILPKASGELLYKALSDYTMHVAGCTDWLPYLVVTQQLHGWRTGMTQVPQLDDRRQVIIRGKHNLSPHLWVPLQR